MALGFGVDDALFHATLIFGVVFQICRYYDSVRDAATRMAAIRDAGMQTSMISLSSMPFPPSRSVLMMAAVAAETGEPVMPKEAAMVATLSGRSGQILEFVAISEIIRSSE